jgi:hypothetical protein
MKIIGRSLRDLHPSLSPEWRSGQIQHGTVRVDSFLQFAVALRCLRSPHPDHQPHHVESWADRVVQTEKALHVEIAFGVRGDSSLFAAMTLPK